MPLIDRLVHFVQKNHNQQKIKYLQSNLKKTIPNFES